MPFGLTAAQASIVGPALGGAISGIGAIGAAGIQSSAAQAASQVQQNEFNQIQGQLQPFLAPGQSAVSNNLPFLLGVPTANNPNPPTAQPLTPPLTAAGQQPTYNMPPFTAAQFQSSPGYQFQLQQGIDAIQNSAAGKTGAVSGNMLKGLQTYGTGLADQDWWNAYNAYVNNYQAQYAGNTNEWLNRFTTQNTQNQGTINNLMNLANLGANAGANLGGFGTTAATNIGNNLIGAGNASAAGLVGAGNSVNSAINSYQNNQLAQQLLGTGYGSGLSPWTTGAAASGTGGF